MVYVYAGNIQRPARLEMIHIRLDGIAAVSPFEIKILHHELVGSFVFIDNTHLPCKKVSDQAALKGLEFIDKAPINRPYGGRHVLPAKYGIAPVIQSIGLGHLSRRVKFGLQVLDKLLLYIFTLGMVVFGLIVYLITDHSRMIVNIFHQPANNTFGIETVRGVRNVHILTGTVGAFTAFCLHQYFRVLPCHPCWDRICWRTYNDMDVVFMHYIQYPANVFKIEHSVLRLLIRPGGLCNTHQIDATFLHKLYIFLQPVVGHIFRVVGHAIEYFRSYPIC